VYSGVLYEALDLASLDGAARRRATSWLAVASGLFGLLRPADRIPAYRLSGDVSLPGIGPVSTYWSGRLDDTVRDAAGRGLVVDLRSSTYASFWRPAPDLAPRVVGLRVLHDVDGTRKVVSNFNKATKGRAVRALVAEGAFDGASMEAVAARAGVTRVTLYRTFGSKRALLEDGSTPRTPVRFADLLRSLGWKGEEGPADRYGARLDVVVSDL